MDCTTFLLKASVDLCPNNKGNPTDTTLSNQHVLATQYSIRVGTLFVYCWWPSMLNYAKYILTKIEVHYFFLDFCFSFLFWFPFFFLPQWHKNIETWYVVSMKVKCHHEELDCYWYSLVSEFINHNYCCLWVLHQ